MSATWPSDWVAAFEDSTFLLSHQADCAPAYIARENLCGTPLPPISADDPSSVTNVRWRTDVSRTPLYKSW